MSDEKSYPKGENAVVDEVEKVEMDIDTLSKMTFMDSLLNKQTEIRNVLDTRSNIVIGFNSALIVLLVTYFRERLVDNPVLWLLMAVLFISLLLSIIALKPPHYSTKKGQHESIFYHHYIDSKEMEDYRAEIHEVLKDKKAIFQRKLKGLRVDREEAELTGFLRFEQKLLENPFGTAIWFSPKGPSE